MFDANIHTKDVIALSVLWLTPVPSKVPTIREMLYEFDHASRHMCPIMEDQHDADNENIYSY